jgi:hypothetical protein
MSFRNGAYLGALVALTLGVFLMWLWQPERQVEKHSAHLLGAIERKDWAKFATFISEDYHDQWNNDRAMVLERTREVFRYARGARISGLTPDFRIEDRTGYWRARITIAGDDQNEVIAAIKARVNSLQTPFELEWHRMSGKPWDWKLVAVRNPEFVVPSDY